MTRILPLLISVFLVFSCAQKHYVVERGAYLWKQNASLSTEDISFLKKLEITTLYVRLFDVNWRDGAVLTPETQGQAPEGFEVIPVVYVTPAVLRHMQSGAAEELASRLGPKIISTSARVIGRNFQEVQIDCDWTSGTKAGCFRLLSELRLFFEKKGIQLTTTLRMHQLANLGEEGVPPVSRVALMPYNLLPVNAYSDQDAILDLPVLKRYLRGRKPYPLACDLIFPVFSWGAHFNMDHKFLGIISGLNREKLKGLSSISGKGGHLFNIHAPVVFENVSCLKGDIVRIDEPDFQSVFKAVRMVLKSGVVTNGTIHVSFFYYDADIINHFTSGKPEKLEKILGAFQ